VSLRSEESSHEVGGCFFATGMCLWVTRSALGQDRKPSTQEYIKTSQRIPPAENVGFGSPPRMKLDPFELSCPSFARFWTVGRPKMDVTRPLTTEQAAAGFSLLPSVPLKRSPRSRIDSPIP
jgi:hypothetical protein